MELITAKEAAAQLRISLRTLDRLVADGKLRVFRVGTRIRRFRSIDVAMLLTAQEDPYADRCVFFRDVPV